MPLVRPLYASSLEYNVERGAAPTPLLSPWNRCRPAGLAYGVGCYRSRKSWWMRGSSSSSGWKARASCLPWRAGDNAAIDGCECLGCIAHGDDPRRADERHRDLADALELRVRMEAPELPAVGVSLDLDVHRREARRAHCHRGPQASWPRRIMPAQVPRVGMPSSMRSRRGSSIPSSASSLPAWLTRRRAARAGRSTA